MAAISMGNGGVSLRPHGTAVSPLPKGASMTATTDLDDQGFAAGKPIRSLWGMLGFTWLSFIWLEIVFIIKNLAFWGIPICLAQVVRTLDGDGTEAMMWTVLGVMAFLLVINIPGHIYFTDLLSRRVRGLEWRLRSALLRRLQLLSIRYHNETASGGLQTKVIRDVEVVEQLTKLVLQNGQEAVITLLFAIAVAAWQKPIVLVFYLIAIPVCFGLMIFFKGGLKKRNAAFRQGMEKVGSHVSEMIDLVPVTRAHGLEQTAMGRIAPELDDLRDDGRRLDVVTAGFHASMFALMRGLELSALIFFAILVMYSWMTLDELVLFMSLFAMMVQSVMMLLGLVPQLARGAEGLTSIAEVLACPDIEENEGRRWVDKVEGHIEFEDLGFRYPDRPNWAVKNCSLSVKSGECVAFVGPSGSGKSTLMNLIIGFFRPTEGALRIDGHDQQEVDMRSVRQHLAVVPQNVILFSGSLQENICYGLEGITPQRMTECIEAANLREVVEALPQGLQTRIGENGVALSGGQRQRVAICRALLRDPRIIILDEATSALDLESERLVQQAIDRLVQGRTTFIVAHRLSTIRQADRVVVLSEGKVVESGGHDELLARGGAFAALHRLQAS